MFVLDFADVELEKKEDVEADEKNEEILLPLLSTPPPPLPLLLVVTVGWGDDCVVEGDPDEGPNDSKRLACLFESLTSVLAWSKECWDRNPNIFSAKS